MTPGDRVSNWYAGIAHRSVEAAWSEATGHGYRCEVPRLANGRPAFGRYILLQIAPEQDFGWFTRPEHLGGARAIDGLVQMGGRPTPIRGSFVDDLLLYGPLNAIVAHYATVGIGDMARVTVGPWEHLVGECIEAERGRVILLMQMMGGRVSVELDDNSVERVAR